MIGCDEVPWEGLAWVSDGLIKEDTNVYFPANPHKVTSIGLTTFNGCDKLLDFQSKGYFESNLVEKSQTHLIEQLQTNLSEEGDKYAVVRHEFEKRGLQAGMNQLDYVEVTLRKARTINLDNTFHKLSNKVNLNDLLVDKLGNAWACIDAIKLWDNLSKDLGVLPSLVFQCYTIESCQTY